MLAVRPCLIGSLPMANTIGIVEVAALAASADGSPPVVAMTVTGNRTSSAAIAGKLSYCPSAKRAKCLRWAQDSANERTRALWLDMAQLWLDRAQNTHTQ